MEEKSLISVLQEKKLVVSASQARRLVIQGAIKVDGELTVDLNHVITPHNKTLSAGKRTIELGDENGGDDHPSE